MSKEPYPYPEDEFDILGAERSTRGVHREPASTFRQWLPYLLVLIIVPLLTFGVVKYFAGGPEPAPVPTASPEETDGQPAEGDADAEDEGAAEAEGEAEADGEGEEAEPEEEPTEEVDLNYNTHILVLNGARITGFAGEVAAFLEGDGWTSTSADNYTGNSPVVTTVFYPSADFEAEARAVAETLEIPDLVESASAATNGIVIVLRAEYTVPSTP